MRFKKTAIAGAVLAVVFGPVLLTQLSPPEPRSFSGAALDGSRYTEIAFPNPAAGLDLAGMLFVPEGNGPFPAVAVIHGSGTSRRNNRWYLTLTHHLQDNGIAVLLPDKRGSEKSGGDWRNASMQDLATDTAAALRFLISNQRIDPTRIGIIGLSQGGWIAPVVADQSADLAFLVNVVGATVRPTEQLHYEENNNLRQIGFLPGVSNLLTYPSVLSITKFRQKSFWDANGDFDPLPYWSALAIPALVLYGSEDSNVPTERSAALLRSLENSNIDVRIYAGSGHALEDPVGQGNRIFRADALDAIVDFIFASGD